MPKKCLFSHRSLKSLGEDLEQFFQGYGLSGRLQLQTDPVSGQPTGIAFVEFTSERLDRS